MTAVGVVYLGLIAALSGIASLVKPLSFLGIRSRLQATFVLGIGLLIAGIGWAFPANEVRVMAPRNRVFQAIKDVTPDEIRLFRTLTWLRRFGRPGPESILNAPEHLPILEVATRTSFLLLAEEPDREIVVGTLVMAPRGWRPKRRPTPEDFKALREPGFTIAAMNFLVEDAGSGACIVTTETRIYATDASARRRFARYWRVIYPGSALIRRMWLRAVKRRAEAASS